MKEIVLIIVSAGVLTFVSCSSSRTTSSADEEIRKYEAQFNPSDHNPDVKAIVREEVRSNKAREERPIELANPGPVELVSGFRVQIFASANIDDASGQKEAAEAMFPDEWFYLVYDPPTYKLRGGNFLTRFEADNFLQSVSGRGFHDAWVVPDRVHKTPPSKVHPLSPNPEQK